MDHLTDDQITLYRSGKLGDAADYGAIDAHVRECPACHERLCRPAAGALRFAARPLATVLDSAAFLHDHPESEVLVDFAQDESRVSQQEATHIRICRRCMEDVIVLRQDFAVVQSAAQVPAPAPTAESVAPSIPTARVPSPAVVSAPPLVRGVEGPRGWDAKRRFWPFPPALRWATATAAFAILLLCVFLVWRRQTVVQIQDEGGVWALNRSGDLSSPLPLPAALQASAQTALQKEALKTPAELASLAGESDALLSPVATFVLSQTPTLAWKPYPGAVKYACTITSPDDPTFRLPKPPKDPKEKPKFITGTSWQLKKPLKRGLVYRWQVIAYLAKGESKNLTPDLSRLPQFKVLDQAKAEELNSQLKIYGRSHLASGLLYAEAGLLDEARGEFDQLLAANRDSEVVKALVSHLEAARRPRS